MNELQMNEAVKEFHSKCGEILRMALAIENYLNFFIPNYFCQPQSYKTFLFGNVILSNLTFERKINIFKAICIREDTDKNEVNKILSSIKFVQKIRNHVAHEDSLMNYPTEGKIVIPKRNKSIRDALELTDELMKQIEKNKMDAINGIVKIHRALSDPNRETKNDVIF